jgi:hypothetical protein
VYELSTSVIRLLGVPIFKSSGVFWSAELPTSRTPLSESVGIPIFGTPHLSVELLTSDTPLLKVMILQSSGPHVQGVSSFSHPDFAYGSVSLSIFMTPP